MARTMPKTLNDSAPHPIDTARAEARAVLDQMFAYHEAEPAPALTAHDTQDEYALVA